MHDRSSVESGFEPGALRNRGRYLTTRPSRPRVRFRSELEKLEGKSRKSAASRIKVTNSLLKRTPANQFLNHVGLSEDRDETIDFLIRFMFFSHAVPSRTRPTFNYHLQLNQKIIHCGKRSEWDATHLQQGFQQFNYASATRHSSGP
ncbi:hypothetical protein AVEN_182139-1 [Araneus ventricosus]|uniref:Uncharacterized protein n=1 Tax=Araneus ventricosus TaxID=182803 RepID=A0A4Y2GQZ0_ARAVE|nr:hypothetical protein AVEN_182139-1 [Araneus ventricosus]